MSAIRAVLPNGQQHFQHGPIDLVIGAEGAGSVLIAAHEAAWQRFEQVLQELVDELAVLRQPVTGSCSLKGPVARRMWHACVPFSDRFITPMAAVAGSVAQEILQAYQRPGLDRAWVNNGGDIALHLTPDYSVRVGLYADIARLDEAQLQKGLTLDGHIDIEAKAFVQGIATSGWRGRSFSLGIADSVTVLAASASQADAAATVIANAVNVQAPGIERVPACQLKDDSDLGDIPVTVNVGPLSHELVQQALQSGFAVAVELQEQGLIQACTLVCQQQFAQLGMSRFQPQIQASEICPPNAYPMVQLMAGHA